CADIKEVDPDIIVFRLATASLNSDSEFTDIIEGDQQRRGPERDKTDWNLLRDLRRQFANELVGYEQVLWVENANGFISPMAFGWEDMVMSPNATIGDMNIWFRMAAGSANGENMFGKYFDAMLGTIEGVAERGGWTHPERWPLLDAMVDPRQRLSTTWVGRRAIFHPHPDGDFVLNNSFEAPMFSITAGDAEDLLITKGVVQDMDDLAILMGWPRYEITKDASTVVNAHRSEWRSLRDRARGAMRAFTQGRQSGDIQGLSTCLRALRQLRGIERSNPAMTYAFQIEGIPTGTQIEILIQQIEEAIKAMREGGGGRGGGGGGRGGGTGGGGVSPGGPTPGGR
ncbi:MAG: hypothetical protein MK074_09380, partial [Phycisphaerales bacterium]|nr:hypothetical protein [Phycisphaerales bacterium]